MDFFIKKVTFAIYYNLTKVTELETLLGQSVINTYIKSKMCVYSLSININYYI